MADEQSMARHLTGADVEALEGEKAKLAAVEGKGVLARWRVYFSLSGPGWMQSAMTLGGGSATASLFAGAFLQYKLLWVQPLAMMLGVIMLGAMSYQTLSTGQRPFVAMKKYVSPAMAWSWLIIALVSTVVWHLPQYALAGGMTSDIITVLTGWEPTGNQQTALLLGLGAVFLAVSTFVCWSYGKGRRGIRLYERILKGLVWMIIVAFAAVIVRASMKGMIDWGQVGKGYLPLHIPTDARGVSVVMAAFGAAIGINMTFLFPYTLLARGWGKEHRGLSRFDLITGMVIPYCVATSLMVIATGCTIYDPEKFAAGATMLPPSQAAMMLEQAGLGTFLSRVVFGLGILGMVLSTITMQMLVCGFAVCELLEVEPSGWRYRLGCLIPAPAMLGVVLWKSMGTWVGIPATAICGVLLPVAYFGFFMLNNSKAYLGDDKPRGMKGAIWNAGMIAAIAVSSASSLYFLYTRLIAS